MIKDSTIYLDDIFESIEKIEGYLRGLTLKDFEEDTKIQDAVLRRLEIIGEAVKKLPKDFKDKYPEIPWRNYFFALENINVEHKEIISRNGHVKILAMLEFTCHT